MECYGFIGRKQCKNEAVWIEHGDYKDDPLISGEYHCQLCDECYKAFTKREGTTGYYRVNSAQT